MSKVHWIVLECTKSKAVGGKELTQKHTYTEQNGGTKKLTHRTMFAHQSGSQRLNLTQLVLPNLTQL